MPPKVELLLTQDRVACLECSVDGEGLLLVDRAWKWRRIRIRGEVERFWRLLNCRSKGSAQLVRNRGESFLDIREAALGDADGFTSLEEGGREFRIKGDSPSPLSFWHALWGSSDGEPHSTRSTCALQGEDGARRELGGRCLTGRLVAFVNSARRNIPFCRHDI